MNSNSAESMAGEPQRKGLGKCNVICPMCAHAHVQYRLNPRMYWNTKTDLDGKPDGFSTLKGIEGCYPPLYDLWCCPVCRFTSSNRTFLDPLKNVFVEKGFVQRRYAETMRADGPLRRACDLLGEVGSADTISFLQAIRVALLAVLCDSLFSEILNQRHAALARSYLRLAWLQRDWKKQDPGFDAAYAEFNDLMDRVLAHWPEAPRTENEALRGACESFSRALKEPAVSGNMNETVDILLILVKLHLQMEEADPAMDALQVCRTEAHGVLQQTVADLRKDDVEKKLSSPERAQKVLDRRKMERILDECQELRQKVREL